MKQFQKFKKLDGSSWPPGYWFRKLKKLVSCKTLGMFLHAVLANIWTLDGVNMDGGGILINTKLNGSKQILNHQPIYYYNKWYNTSVFGTQSNI